MCLIQHVNSGKPTIFSFFNESFVLSQNQRVISRHFSTEWSHLIWLEFNIQFLYRHKWNKQFQERCGYRGYFNFISGLKHIVSIAYRHANHIVYYFTVTTIHCSCTRAPLFIGVEKQFIHSHRCTSITLYFQKSAYWICGTSLKYLLTQANMFTL